MAAHGVSIIELEQRDDKWRPLTRSPFNRRISAANTEMSVDGPAAGHPRLQTSADPSGRRIVGTFNNCAGGVTPWGTYLAAEENFHGYFWTDQMEDKDGKQVRRKKGLGGDQADSYARYGVPANWYNWGAYQSRFNVDKEPNEPNRFGWVIEIDPFDTSSTPVKHTALGRFRHEGSECILSSDGRAVVYSGDDAGFEYVYRFVSANKMSDDRDANKALLSEGALSVARFNANGTVDWLPLIYGDGPLVPENGWESQAQVLIDARLAATALGATPMDRPEDVQPNEQTGKIYVMLTNNDKRKEDQIDKANPRADNLFGHIIEMTAPGRDHAADQFTWQVLIKCGDPSVAEVGSLWNPATSANGWFGSPDNCTIDGDGRLWVATDQGKTWHKTGKSDGLYAVDRREESEDRGDDHVDHERRDRDDDRLDERAREGRCRGHAEEHAEHHAEHRAEHRDDGCFPTDHHPHLGPRHAHGPQEPELAGALVDRQPQGVVDAEECDEQREHEHALDEVEEPVDRGFLGLLELGLVLGLRPPGTWRPRPRRSP